MRFLTLIMLMAVAVSALHLNVNGVYTDLAQIDKITFTDFGQVLDIGDSLYTIADIQLIEFGTPPVTARETLWDVAETEFVLEPNPFNPRLRIRLPAASNPVCVQIMDATGRLCWQTTTKANSVEWDAKNGSGTYIIRVVFGDRILTKKAVLLK